ncbi:MAG: hypothetical protein NT069_04965, partial [Planctomycetota bacterium]|nr:hypothetical protein [Planctomycetota bacterium]
MATATIKLAGFEFRPTADFLSDLQQFAQDPSKPAPQFARPVFTDPEGNRLLAIPSRDGILGVPVTTAPEVESPHAAGPRGGFVRAQPDPPAGSPPGGADMQALFRGMAQDLALKTGGAALSQAVVAAMTGAAPGGALSGAMNALGMSVPGMFGSLASQAVQSLGLGGLGGTAGQLAGQAATSLATSLMGGDPGALLSQLGNALGGSAGASAATAAQNLMQGGCFGGAAKGPSLGDLGVSALSGAADKALDLWKIDDESSAAETVAKSLVTKYKDQLKQLGMDPDAFLEKINAFFNGAAVGTGKFAVRQTDKDDKVDISAVGVANILVEKKPISRIGDKLAPSGKPILMGSPTVLSAGVPTAFLTVPTGVPSMMVMGAPTVLVGIPPGMAIPAPAPDTADPNSAKAPEKPESPQGGAAKGSSAKGGTGD